MESIEVYLLRANVLELGILVMMGMVRMLQVDQRLCMMRGRKWTRIHYFGRK